MTIHETWKLEKQKPENKNMVLLFPSGVFYKSFDDDARFLSDKLGFKLKIAGGYETVGFPDASLIRHKSHLAEHNFGYVIYEKIEGEYRSMETSTGTRSLDYKEENLSFVTTPTKKEKFVLEDFLKELKTLLDKYY